MFTKIREWYRDRKYHHHMTKYFRELSKGPAKIGRIPMDFKWR